MKLASTLLLSFTLLSAQAQELSIASLPHTLFWDNRPVSYSIKGNTLTLVAGEKTDMFRDPNVTYNTDNAPKLLFKADENFVLTASIEHTFASKWDGGALVIKSDSLHWVKFCYEKDYTGARRVVSVVTKNVSDDCNSVELTANKVFYKIAKAGNVITLYYSVDDKSYYLVRHLQFDFDKEIHVGFLAQSPTGKTCEVKFGSIHYETRKISDPYTGQ
jgi:hypothetical protein